MDPREQFFVDVGVDPADPTRLARFSWWVQGWFRRMNRWWVVLPVLTLAIVGWTALREVDSALKTMHLENTKAYTVSSLEGPGFAPRRDWDKAAETWQAYYKDACQMVKQADGTEQQSCRRTAAGGLVRPEWTLSLHLIIDTFLYAWPVAFLLWFLLY